MAITDLNISDVGLKISPLLVGKEEVPVNVLPRRLNPFTVFTFTVLLKPNRKCAFTILRQLSQLIIFL